MLPESTQTFHFLEEEHRCKANHPERVLKSLKASFTYYGEQSYAKYNINSISAESEISGDHVSLPNLIWIRITLVPKFCT